MPPLIFIFTIISLAQENKRHLIRRSLLFEKFIFSYSLMRTIKVLPVLFHLENILFRSMPSPSCPFDLTHQIVSRR